jgi:NAD(P)-dependent dehydrogenase (short-subunit alcohol dehydrogenase family)
MKKAIIWGSEGGIGNAILSLFVKEGFETAAIARKITPASESADWQYEGDFSNKEDVERIGQKLSEEFGQADIFVFAAGDIASEKVSQASMDRWLEVLNNNLSGAFLSLQASLPVLKDDSHIFLLGAVSERLQLPGLSAYAAAKAGLEAFAVSLTKEERMKKVTVVRPGAVATSLWDKVPFKQPSKAYEPVQVAAKIWQAYQEGHTGNLDLT